MGFEFGIGFVTGLIVGTLFWLWVIWVVKEEEKAKSERREELRTDVREAVADILLPYGQSIGGRK